MKNSVLLLGFLFAASFFTSCSSSSENPQPTTKEGFVRFKVNGVQKEYKTGPSNLLSFSFDSNGPVYNTIIQVLGPGSTGTSDFIQINVRNEDPFVINQDYRMQDEILYQGLPLSRIIFTYADEQGQIFNAVILDTNSPFLEVKEDASFRFTKITEDWVEGTFSALIIGPVTNLSRGNQEVIISEGQFSMGLIDLTP